MCLILMILMMLMMKANLGSAGTEIFALIGDVVESNFTALLNLVLIGAFLSSLEQNFLLDWLLVFCVCCCFFQDLASGNHLSSHQAKMSGYILDLVVGHLNIKYS